MDSILDIPSARERRMRWIGRMLLLVAILGGAILLSSTAFCWRVQWLSSSTPGAYGEAGWWFRRCDIDAGQFRCTSFGFLGMQGAPPGRPPMRGMEDKAYVAPRDHLSLDLWSFTFPSPGGRFELFLPMWPFFAALAAGGIVLRRSAAKLRRAREQHLCPECGYDLRASPERCPECGRPVSSGTNLPT